MENPKLALIPSGYKPGYSSGKVYSILPVDGVGDFDFGRGAEATRVREDGLIETVSNYEPRLDWLNNDCPNLLLEPQRTNRLGYSEQFNASNWGKSNSTIDPDSTISPTGELSSDKLIANTVNAEHFIQATVSGLSTSSAATFSIFIKKAEISQVRLLCAQNSSPFTNWGRIDFDLETLSVFGTSAGTFGYEDYGNGWIRLFTTGTPTSSNALIRISLMKNSSLSFAGNDNDGFYLFGAQVEQGIYPSSYIKTLAGIVTRLIDSAGSSGDSSLFNDVEGTLFINAAALGNDNTYRVISVCDGGTANRVLIQLGNGSNQIRADIVSNNSTQASISSYSYDITKFNKIALRYKQNDVALYINGTLIGTDTNANNPVNLNTLNFTNGNLGSLFYFTGKLKELKYFDKALSNSELEILTTI